MNNYQYGQYIKALISNSPSFSRRSRQRYPHAISAFNHHFSLRSPNIYHQFKCFSFLKHHCRSIFSLFLSIRGSCGCLRLPHFQKSEKSLCLQIQMLVFSICCSLFTFFSMFIGFVVHYYNW